MSENTFKIPVIPLRGLTILPGTTVHFDISRKSSIAAAKMCIRDRCMTGEETEKLQSIF